MVVVIVAAQLTPTIAQALAVPGAIVLRPTTIESSALGASNIGELEATLQNHAPHLFTTGLSARAYVRARLRRADVGIFSFIEAADVSAQRARARSLFESGHIESSLAVYEEIVTSGVGTKEETNAAQLGAIVSLLNLGREDDARIQARLLDVSALQPPAQLTAARVLTSLSIENQPEISDDSLDELRAFQAILGGAVPAIRPRTADLALQGAFLLIREHRFETAANWILAAVDEARRNAVLGVFFLEATAALIEEWCWNSPSDVPLVHETAAQLLSESKRLERALNGQDLDRLLIVRLLHATFLLAMRCADLTKMDRIAKRLSELDATIPPQDGFAAAIDLAKNGDLEAATKVLGSTDPEWRGRMQRAMMLFLAGQDFHGLVALLELAREQPGIPLVEVETARRLVEQERYSEARPHAETAFLLLPGIGQRLVFAACLVAVDEHDRAAQLLAASVEDDMRARVLFAQAIENSKLQDALQHWDIHLQSHTEDWRAATHVIALFARAGDLRTAAQRAWGLIGTSAPKLPSTVLFECALLQSASGIDESAQLDRLKHILTLLEERARPEDDKLRVSLWMHLQNNEALPAADPQLLEKSRRAQQTDDQQTAELKQGLRRLYEWGDISLEAASTALADDPAAFVLALGDAAALPLGEPPSTLDAPPSLSVFQEIQVGLYELLALSRLTLLPRFSQCLGDQLQLRVFEDIPLELLHLVLRLSQERPQEQAAHASRLLTCSELGVVLSAEDRQGTTWVSTSRTSDEIDLASFFVWMRDRGTLSLSAYNRATAGLPPPQDGPPPLPTIGIRLPALRWLVDRDLLELISRAVGTKLRFLQADVDELRAGLETARRRTAALSLAKETHRWLGEQLLSGRAALGVRPAVRVPNIRPNALEFPVRSVVLALMAREALILSPSRCAVEIDPFGRDLFAASAFFLPKSLHAFEWPPALYRELRDRYRPSADRAFGLAWLALQLAPEHANELTDELLMWGDSSAFSPSSLMQLVREYPTLAGRADRMLSLQEIALSQPAHSRHPATHFTLAMVEGAFLRKTLEQPPSDPVESWWAHLLTRWHPASATQKIWLLGFAMTALVDAAPAAFEPVPETDKLRMSPTSTVAAAARALAQWAQGEASDIFGHVVSEILLTIDEARDGAPQMVDLAPIVMLLDNANPPADIMSLSHSWIEPLAIFSSTWTVNPLAIMFERFEADGQTYQFTLAELITRAVALTESTPNEVQLGLTGTHFNLKLTETVQVKAEVPLESVILGVNFKIAKGLCLHVASNVGRFDGVLYSTLLDLAEEPDNTKHRHTFARAAVASSMRRIRRTPGMLAYWGLSDALPEVLNVTTLEALRAILSEPDAAPENAAASRLSAYATTIWKDRLDLGRLAGQCARFPGVMGWQWARRAIELEEKDAFAWASHWVEHPETAHFGQLWWSIATQWLRAGLSDEPAARDSFVSTIDKLLEHLVAHPERGRLETRALRCMRFVIARLHASNDDSLWLTYRLFGWWFAVVSEGGHAPESALDELTSGEQAQQGTASMDDAAEPLRWSEDFDVRLSSVLNALSICPDPVSHELKEANKLPWQTAMSEKTIGTLIELASKDLGDEPGHSEWMGWVPPLRVSTAALAALFRNGGKFSQLPPSAREAWLSWIPTTRAEDQLRPKSVVLQLIQFAVLELTALTPLEGALLADRCLRSEAPTVRDSPITALAIAAAAGRRLVTLEGALARVTPHLSDTDIGRILVAVFMDSVVDVAPEKAQEYALGLLRQIGRTVDETTLLDVLRAEPSFDTQEAVRARLVEALTPPT